MSRILKVMVALLAIAAIAAPVMAEDRLSLGGQMRVRGWHIDNDGQDNTESWMDQRLRIGGKLSIAEGVSITFRTDITESTWGSGNANGSGRTTVQTPSGGYSDFQSQHWDRAHIDLEKNDMHLRAGQQFIKFGKSGIDVQDNGLTFNYKGAIPVTVFWMLYDDGDSKNNSDGYYYGARVAHGTDAYKASLFYIADSDRQSNVINGIGVTFETKIADLVNLYAEIEGFDGDSSTAASGDATGLQGYVDASMMLSEAVTIGGQFFYADSADSGDTQVVVLGNNFDGWDPLLEVGTGLSNEEIDLGRPYDVFGMGSGFIGGRIYSNFKASDALNLGASFAYGEPETDRTGDNVDGMIALAGGMSYDLMANTKLDLQLQYVDLDKDDDSEEFSAGVGLFVNF